MKPTAAEIIGTIYLLLIVAVLLFSEYAQTANFTTTANINAQRLIAKYAQTHDPDLRQRLCTINQSLHTTASKELRAFAEKERCPYD